MYSRTCVRISSATVFGTVDMGAYEYVCSSNDYDGDGMDNDAEAIADTDSTDPASMLAITDITLTNSMQIVWIGGEQCRQFLEIKHDLVFLADFSDDSLKFCPKYFRQHTLFFGGQNDCFINSGNKVEDIFTLILD